MCIFSSLGSHSTVVVCWTADEQVKWLILHLWHDSYQNSFHKPRLSSTQYSLIVQNGGLKKLLLIYNSVGVIQKLTEKKTPYKNFLCVFCDLQHTLFWNLLEHLVLLKEFFPLGISLEQYIKSNWNSSRKDVWILHGSWPNLSGMNTTHEPDMSFGLTA